MNRFRTKVAAASIAALTLTVVAVAQAATDHLGVSTATQRIVPDSSSGFNFLTTGPGEGYLVRDGSEDGAALGQAVAGREKRRTSLTYFGQLTDFQLADEESPLRVEFLDPQGPPFNASYRPAEALNPQEENQMIRQFNAFSTRPPHLARGNAKPKMDFVINTGDVSDNNQYNETLWNRQLVEGNEVSPGSGVDPAPYIGKNPLCPAGMDVKDAADPSLYTGVQDRDDFPAPTMGYFYDPDSPNPVPDPPNPGFVNPNSSFPAYPGLMNRAQKPFKAVGLKVPSYMAFGNHDTLVQGNGYGSQIFEQIAVGCLKPINDHPADSGRPTEPLLGFVLNADFNAQDLLNLRQSEPDYFMEVPPDPDRHLLSKKDYMQVFRDGADPTGHGFNFVDKATRAASNGYSGYYSFSPRPGVRFITLDTASEGGKILTSDKGNLDDPQFQWFEGQLQKATANNEIAIVFSHHAVESLTADVPDENAPGCADVDPAAVPGCDGDPRASTPIHLKDDAIALMHKYPNAVAWVAGHSHVNDIASYPGVDGKGGFWGIRTSALADWPKQNRLVEVFDDRDGNLSIFGTVIDHAAGVEAPAAGTDAASMSDEQLASLSRTLGYNDPQDGAEACGSVKCGEGDAKDRNVELLIKDPRRPQARVNAVKVAPKRRRLRAGRKFKLRVRVSNFVTATADAKRVRVTLRSSNRRVKVRRRVVIARIQPGRAAVVKVPVRARRNARGKARIRVTVAGKKAAAVVRVIPRKKHRKHRHH